MNHLKDSFKHKGKRKILIESLKEMGIKDDSILNAFYQIPRHYFLDWLLMNKPIRIWLFR